jgi:ABC-type multidrug transport system permease subunit
VALEPVSEPGGRYIDFLIPGLLGMNMMNGGLWGVGFVLVEMRIKKLLKRLAATPMRRADFLLAVLSGRLIVILLEVALLLGFGHVLFGVAVRGSWLALGLISALGCLCFASMGLLVGSRAVRSETAAGLVNVLTLPMMLLSGVFFSYERFPEWLHPLLRLLPLTALNDALRSVLNEGAGLLEQTGRLGVLLAWTALCFALALRRFRWT